MASRCVCAGDADEEIGSSTVADALTLSEARELLCDAPAHVQDVCAVAREYANCAHARAVLCYKRMREICDANKLWLLATCQPRNLSREDAQQRLYQACMLLVHRPDVCAVPCTHFNAIRVSAIYLLAILLCLQDATPLRVNIEAERALEKCKSLSTHAAQAVVAILRAAMRVVGPLHGSAYAPSSILVTPTHPSLRRVRANASALGYEVSETVARQIRSQLYPPSALCSDEPARADTAARVSRCVERVQAAQERFKSGDLARLNREADEKLAIFAEATADVKRALVRLSQAEAAASSNGRS